MKKQVICARCGSSPKIIEQLSTDEYPCYDVSKVCSCGGDWTETGKRKKIATQLKDTQIKIQKTNTVRKAIHKARSEIHTDMATQFNNFLEERKSAITQQVISYNDVTEIKGIHAVVISEEIFKPIIQNKSYAGFVPDYTADDFGCVLQFLQHTVAEINKNHIDFIPNLSDVCKLMGMSERKFKEYMNHSNDERTREMCEQIQSYIYGLSDHASKSSRIDSKTHMFDAERTLGKKADYNIVNNNTTNIVSEKVLIEEYEKMKKANR